MRKGETSVLGDRTKTGCSNPFLGEAKMGHKHPIKRLTAVKVRNAKPGKHADGGGLYLRVTDDGRKNWILRTVIRGKRCELGLGPVKAVSLAEAREEATRLRKIARKGGDPLAERRQEHRIVPSFEEAAREVHKSHSKAFRNAKHKKDWLSSLSMYAFPIFGSRAINAIESKNVLEALMPIWTEKPETARRVRQRLRAVFDYARAKAWVSINPVDGIKTALPKHTDKQKHFAALPYAKIPEFIESIWKANNIGLASKYALEFLILTAARTSEVIYAGWDEIDIEAKTWTIPGERMKAQQEHRIPLSPRCLQILKGVKSLSHGQGYIFAGRSEGRPLSNMALAMALRRMGRAGITVHGFRSSFRDWAEEKTNTQRSVVEAALAHQVESKVEAAYLRTTLFEKRRRLLDSWAAFATVKPTQKVVRMDSRAYKQ